MSIPNLEYPWRTSVADILNAGAARSVIVKGNVDDLFWLPPKLSGTPEGSYVSILDHLRAHWERAQHTILVTYTPGGPVRFACEEDRELVREDWLEGADAFDADFLSAVGKPAVALTLMTQACKLAREAGEDAALRGKRFIFLIERADTIVPEGPITSLNEADRHRVMICQSWLCDPAFLRGNDGVVFLTESAAQVNSRLVKLPQVLQVAVPPPDEKARAHFIAWFNRCQKRGRKIKLAGTQSELVQFTAGLTIHALRQLLMANVYSAQTLDPSHVFKRVEDYIESQVGEGVVRFKRPTHTRKDLVGVGNLLRYLDAKIIPRLRAGGSRALSGFVVGGPIGGGKTYTFEAIAAEVDMVVLELRNLRSKWFGETDIILERLYRVLCSLSKVMVFVDEADTVFGGLGADVHETEKRLTGEIQKWMADSGLRGRVVWVLMTARIQNLSADIRRPGRAGDLIIPVLDPEGSERDEFIAWTVKGVLGEAVPANGSWQWKDLDEAMNGFSAADFSSLRLELTAEAGGRQMSLKEVLAVAQDKLTADIAAARKYQTLQALVNCTVKQLLPGGAKLTKAEALQHKAKWTQELREMEAAGLVS